MSKPANYGTVRAEGLSVFFAVLDYIAVIIAEIAAFGLQNLLTSDEYRIGGTYLFLWVPLIFLIFLYSTRAYTHMQPVIIIVRDVCHSVGYGIVTCLVILYLFQNALTGGRLYVLLFAVLVLFDILVLRLGARYILKRRHMLEEPVVFVGAGVTAERVIDYFERDIGYRYRVLGFFDDNPKSDMLMKHYPLLGKVEDAADEIAKMGIDTVIITAPGMNKDNLGRLIASIQPHVRFIDYVPDLIGTPMSSITVDTLFSEKIMLMKLHNNLAGRRNRLEKRLFDLVCSVLGGILILPIIIVTAILIKLDSPGPVFYNAARIGRGGREFTCFKFRSMFVNGDDMLEDYFKEHPAARHDWAKYAKIKGRDPRVTRVGRFIRRTSIDELPQVWNGSIGDMSRGGPRPHLPREKERIGGSLSTITLTPPGITGYWQTCGRADTTFEERIAMDKWYVRNWSIWLDLLYLAKTFSAVVDSKGAY